MNYSRQREFIYNALKNTTEHPTAETVYSDLKKDYPALSLATVYRNLNQMCDGGTVKRLRIPNSPDRYDGCVRMHHHLSCSQCHRVLDVNVTPQMHDYCENSLVNSSHRIDSYEVLFFGVCQDCMSIHSA